MMLYTYPDYYWEFTCVADKCEETCCAKWQIVIDDESLARYKNYKGQYSEILQKGIDLKNEIFKQDKCGRCYFLDEDNLCDMHKNMGEDALCYTCKMYPRHIEEFENVREYNLSISCPEVARILLSRKEPVNYIEKYIEEDEEEYEDYDLLLYSYLEGARVKIKEILQDRTSDIWSRFASVWSVADKLQSGIDNNDMFADDVGIYEVTEEKIANKLSMLQGYDFAKNVSDTLWKLESISKEWDYQFLETEMLLYRKGKDAYETLSREYDEWISRNMKELDIVLEQIMVYFIYTYMCGAVYDGYLNSKIRMSLVSMYYINEMLKARWIKNDKTLEFDDVIYATYKYSRQLEHSDENLIKMEEMMDEM